MSAGRPLTFYQRLQRHVGLSWYPISISVVMFCLFSTFGLAAGQVQETLANYVIDRERPWADFEWLRAGVTFLSVFVFAATLRYWTARLLGVNLRGVHDIAMLNRWQKVFVGIGWFAPWFGAALSLADAALALMGAQAAADRGFFADVFELARAFLTHPLQTPFTPLAGAAVLCPLLFLALWWSPLAAYLSRTVGRSALNNILHRWLMPALFLVLAVLFFFMPEAGIELAREIGPIPIICVSFAVITAAGSYLILLGRQHGVPAFPVAVLLPLVLGAVGMDDNHFVRAREPMLEIERPNASAALRAFQSERGAGPILLVSSEGGGIRAAFYTAAVLARLADQCPRLARRIFLISGVSGGAIGAAAYRASLDVMPLDGEGCNLDEEAPPGPRQSALMAMFSQDHLSPTLAKQMFPELIQAFAPASFAGSGSAFLPQTDRQLGLELSLEHSFADAFGVARAQSPFAASAFSASSAPYLLINMTETSSGGVFVASPLDLADVRPRHRWLHDFRCLWSAPGAADESAPCISAPDFRLSTMAASSARFPIVSPAGSVRAQDVTLRFVDGGYFDNSGVETLLGVMEHLQIEARERGARLPPISIMHIDSNPYVQRLPPKWRLDFDVHELQAVLATREERVRISLSHLSNLYQDGRICSLRFVEASENHVPLRLGWILSNRAAEDLEGQARAQLAGAFTGAAPPICDGAGSSALHAASDRYAERLAMSPLNDPGR